MVRGVLYLATSLPLHTSRAPSHVHHRFLRVFRLVVSTPVLKEHLAAKLVDSLSMLFTSQLHEWPQLLSHSSTLTLTLSRLLRKSFGVDDVVHGKSAALQALNAVVVVENIDLYWVDALGRAWDIPPKFFAQHTSNPDQDSPKKPIVEEAPSGFLRSSRWEKIHHWHVDGVSGLDQPGAAIRGQRLTRLAFLYIPMSFVTGVFGMNVMEINGSPVISLGTCSGVGCNTSAYLTAAVFNRLWTLGKSTTRSNTNKDRPSFTLILAILDRRNKHRRLLLIRFDTFDHAAGLISIKQCCDLLQPRSRRSQKSAMA